MSRTTLKLPADRDVSLVGERHRDEDWGAEGDVVERVDQVGEQVHESAARQTERPMKIGER